MKICKIQIETLPMVYRTEHSVWCSVCAIGSDRGRDTKIHVQNMWSKWQLCQKFETFFVIFSLLFLTWWKLFWLYIWHRNLSFGIEAILCTGWFWFFQQCLPFALYGSTSRYWLSVTFLGEMVGEQDNKRRRGALVWKGSSGRCESRHWIEFLCRWSEFGNSTLHLNRLWGRLKAKFRKSIQNITGVCWTDLARCVWWCL